MESHTAFSSSAIASSNSTSRRRFAAAAGAVMTLAVTGCSSSGGAVGSTSGAVSPPETSSFGSSASSGSAHGELQALRGLLMFARFDESTHTFLSMHSISPGGTGEREVPMPGPEAGGGWANTRRLYAVLTELPDHRIGTVIIGPTGTIVRRLAPPPRGLNLVCTVWSPDDKRLACEGWGVTDDSLIGLWTVRASDGRDVRRLTRPPRGYADFQGDYAPDGSAFIFERTVDEDPGTLMTVNPDGGKPHALTDLKVEDPGAFSPDGSMIATSTGNDLLILDPQGHLVHTIKGNGASLFGPDWSPYGGWIAYSRGVGGPFADIWVSRPDGADALQVTDTPDNEITVSWGR